MTAVYGRVSRREPSFSCGKCDAVWHGDAVAHCRRCHVTWHDADLFDAHLTPESCQAPQTMLVRGLPLWFSSGMWRT